MLSREEVRRVYGRMASSLDALSFYERPAVETLLRHSNFGEARSVFEFGCGTGRFAERLLAAHAQNSTYDACDLTPAMVRLAKKRLARFGDRATVALTDGSLPLLPEAGRFDRFVCAYVLDLLPTDFSRQLIAEAHRVLNNNGLACLISLTWGNGIVSRALSSVWNRLYSIAPKAVGGCRPIDVMDSVDIENWRIEFSEIVVRLAVPSQVLVLKKTPNE